MLYFYTAIRVAMHQQRFGGPWTDIKQIVLGKYLSAYTLIFARNPKAGYYRLLYRRFRWSGFRAARQKIALRQGFFKKLSNASKKRQRQCDARA